MLRMNIYLDILINGKLNDVMASNIDCMIKSYRLYKYKENTMLCIIEKPVLSKFYTQRYRELDMPLQIIPFSGLW